MIGHQEAAEHRLYDLTYRGTSWPYKCPQIVYDEAVEDEKKRERKAQWHGRNVRRLSLRRLLDRVRLPGMGSPL
jgi:hypothetical protein